jgi:NAD+ kinase|tara:strand:+ start:1503 stop:2327 length:825 start_codon:yes stop_codon:yes gene_type:complete
MVKQLRIGVTSKVHRTDILKVAKEIQEKLNNKCKLSFKKVLGQKIGFRGPFIDFKNPNLDVIITIGGDGTILDTAREVNGHNIAVLGVKRGGKGFLSEIQEDMDKKLDLLIRGKYFIENRMKLNVKVNNKQIGEVLNDAVICNAMPGHIQHFALEVHGDSIDSISADGIIIATPTGSTAYSLSAGGPIVEPTLDAYEITPISPFRLNPRSIVVPANTLTKVRITSARKGLLILDGDKQKTITKKDTIHITRGKNTTKFIKFEKDFLKKARKVLS